MTHDLLTPRLLNLPAALARRHARPGTDAHEELVAEGLLALVRAAGYWRPGRHASLATYCWVGVRRAIAEAAGACRKRHTHAKRWAGLVPLEALGREGATRAGRDDHARRAEAADAARAVVRRLPSPLAEVFVLRHAHGLDCARISKLFGHHRGWASPRLRRAENLAALIAAEARVGGRCD